MIQASLRGHHSQQSASAFDTATTKETLTNRNLTTAVADELKDGSEEDDESDDDDGDLELSGS